MVVPQQLSLHVCLSWLLCGKNLLSDACVHGRAICDMTLQYICWSPAANLLAKYLAGICQSAVTQTLTHLPSMSIHTCYCCELLMSSSLPRAVMQRFRLGLALITSLSCCLQDSRWVKPVQSVEDQSEVFPPHTPGSGSTLVDWSQLLPVHSKPTLCHLGRQCCSSLQLYFAVLAVSPSP